MSSQLINQVLELTNAERAKAGLNPLTLNTQLSQAAEDHSDSMANDDFFSHTGADGSSVGDRVQDADYQYSRVGENIAAGQSTAEEVVQGWMDSPGHRANILNADYTEIGLGYEYLANDTGSVNYNHYWTQVFGTPLGNSNSGGDSNQPNSPVEQTDDSDSTPIEDINNDDVLPLEENNDTNTTENIDTDISGAETEADNVDSTPVEESNASLDNSDTNSMDSMDSEVDESTVPESDNFDGDLTGTSGNSVMTGGDDAVDFSNEAGASDNYQLQPSDGNFSDFSDLLSSLGQGDINYDANDLDSLITEYMSNGDLNKEQKQLIQDNMDSFL